MTTNQPITFSFSISYITIHLNVPEKSKFIIPIHFSEELSTDGNISCSELPWFQEHSQRQDIFGLGLLHKECRSLIKSNIYFCIIVLVLCGWYTDIKANKCSSINLCSGAKHCCQANKVCLYNCTNQPCWFSSD